MVDLFQQNLVALERLLQLALILLPLDRHAENIRGALQERDVVFGKLAFEAAVDFKHAKRFAVALQNDIHGAANAVLDQQFRRAKPLFVFEMIRNHRLAGVQRIARG